MFLPELVYLVELYETILEHLFLMLQVVPLSVHMLPCLFCICLLVDKSALGLV